MHSCLQLVSSVEMFLSWCGFDLEYYFHIIKYNKLLELSVHYLLTLQFDENKICTPQGPHPVNKHGLI